MTLSRRYIPIYGLVLLTAAGLIWLTDVISGFLGEDAAASFVALIGAVVLTFHLPRWGRLGGKLLIVGGLLVLIMQVLGAEAALLVGVIGGLLWVQDQAAFPEKALLGVQLVILILVGLLCITITGQIAGTLLAILLNLFLVSSFKLPKRASLVVYGLLGAAFLAILLTYLAIPAALLVLLGLGFLLFYQPQFHSWIARGFHALVVIAVFGLLMMWAGARDGFLLGLAVNFVLISTPSRHSYSGRSSWERGVISQLELTEWKGRILYRAIMLVLLVLAITVAFPFAYAFTAGLKESNMIFRSGLQLWPDHPIWETYQTAWDRFDIFRLFKNTVIIVITGLMIQISVSTLAAYSLSRLKPIAGRYILLGFLVTLMIPNIAYLVPLYVTVARLPVLHTSLLGSYWGIWLPYAVNAFTIFVLKNFFDNLPSELFDAAKVDGANAMQILQHIALPLTRPILIVLSILTFVNYWKDFLWPYLILLTARDKMPVSVYLFEVSTTSTAPLNVQMASYFLAMVPPLIIAILLQRYMRQGLSIGAVKG